MKEFFEVLSIHNQKKIKLAGFEKADRDLKIIKWLRRGEDFREFIIADIENELYSQDKTAQLLSVNCFKKPEYKSKALQESECKENKAILMELNVTFYLLACVQSSNGAIWEIQVEQNYHATNMQTPRNFKLKLNFNIVSQQEISDHVK